jgi:hypothetical protein
MSTLWTPEGEHPVGSPRRPAAPPTPPGAPPAAPPPTPPGDGPTSDEDFDVEALRQQLAQTPVEVVVANHAFGLFELAALHLSLQPPQLEEARLAIDAVAALVDGLAGRLGEAEPTLNEGLAQLRLAFVQIKAASTATPAPGEAPDGPSPAGDPDDPDDPGA